MCLVSFVDSGSWAFAAVQLVIFIASGFLQMRRTSCQSFRGIIVESFNVGLPCNTLQRMLLEEKTFEAPLSLFVQLPESGHLVSSYLCFVVFVFASLKCLIIFDTSMFLSNIVDYVEDMFVLSTMILEVCSWGFHVPKFPQYHAISVSMCKLGGVLLISSRRKDKFL